MKIERISNDKLSKEEWVFAPHVTTLEEQIIVRLNKYYFSVRETTRHKFMPTKIFEGNRPNYLARDRINQRDVPLPQDVIQQAKETIVSAIKFEF